MKFYNDEIIISMNIIADEQQLNLEFTGVENCVCVFSNATPLQLQEDFFLEQYGARGISLDSTLFRKIVNKFRPTNSDQLSRVIAIANVAEILSFNHGFMDQKGLYEIPAYQEEYLAYISQLPVSVERSTILNHINNCESISAYVEFLKANQLQDWQILAVSKFSDLLSYDDATDIAIDAMKEAYIKIMYPEIFYAAYITLHASLSDYQLINQGLSNVAMEYALSCIERDEIKADLMRLVIEMYDRGIANNVFNIIEKSEFCSEKLGKNILRNSYNLEPSRSEYNLICRLAEISISAGSNYGNSQCHRLMVAYGYYSKILVNCILDSENEDSLAFDASDQWLMNMLSWKPNFVLVEDLMRIVIHLKKICCENDSEKEYYQVLESLAILIFLSRIQSISISNDSDVTHFCICKEDYISQALRGYGEDDLACKVENGELDPFDQEALLPFLYRVMNNLPDLLEYYENADKIMEENFRHVLLRIVFPQILKSLSESGFTLTEDNYVIQLLNTILIYGNKSEIAAAIKACCNAFPELLFVSIIDVSKVVDATRKNQILFNLDLSLRQCEDISFITASEHFQLIAQMISDNNISQNETEESIATEVSDDEIDDDLGEIIFRFFEMTFDEMVEEVNSIMADSEIPDVDKTLYLYSFLTDANDQLLKGHILQSDFTTIHDIIDKTISLMKSFSEEYENVCRLYFYKIQVAGLMDNQKYEDAIVETRRFLQDIALERGILPVHYDSCQNPILRILDFSGHGEKFSIALKEMNKLLLFSVGLEIEFNSSYMNRNEYIFRIIDFLINSVTKAISYGAQELFNNYMDELCSSLATYSKLRDALIEN